MRHRGVIGQDGRERPFHNDVDPRRVELWIGREDFADELMQIQGCEPQFLANNFAVIKDIEDELVESVGRI